MAGSAPIDAGTLARIQRLREEVGGTTESLLRELVAEAVSARGGPVPEWSRFTSRLAHELRTPLASLSMMVELMSEATVAAAPGGGESRYPPRMKQAVDELLQIIDGVHTLARIEGGRESLRRREVSIDECLADLERAAGPTAVDRGYRLDLHCDVKVRAVRFEVDREQLVAILEELVLSALRMTLPGAITVNCRLEGTTEPGEEPRREIVFEVSDNGAPIPEGDHERVFVPFDPAASRGSRRRGGSGLELVVARARARLLGGSLSAESADSTTRLRLRLPAASRGESSNRSDPTGGPATARRAGP